MKIDFEVILDDGYGDGKVVIAVFKLDKYLYAFVDLGESDEEDVNVLFRDNWAGALNYYSPFSAKITPEQEERALEILSLPQNIEKLQDYIEKIREPRLTKKRIEVLEEDHIPDQKEIIKQLKEQDK